MSDPTAADVKARRNGNKHSRLQELQSLAIRKAFWEAHGREPSSFDEVREWLTHTGLTVGFDPTTILSPEEIEQFDLQWRERLAEQDFDSE